MSKQNGHKLLEMHDISSQEFRNEKNLKNDDSSVTVHKSAREAWQTQDAAASKSAHDVKRAPEVHGGAGSEYVKSIIFGGLDGIITTFAVVAAAAGASLSIGFILLSGFSNLIADAVSMGLGDYLSEKANLDFLQSEYKRELWEFENFEEGERKEMIALYQKKGMSEEDATEFIQVFSQYKIPFVKLMMMDELGSLAPEEDANPLINGIITFCSFLVCGSVPLWVYVIVYASGVHNKRVGFGISIAATAVTIFLLGCLKGKIAQISLVKSGFWMLVNGALANVLAYLIGWGLESAFNLGHSG